MTWEQPLDSLFDKYRVQYTREDTGETGETGQTDTEAYTINNLYPGARYTIEVGKIIHCS